MTVINTVDIPIAMWKDVLSDLDYMFFRVPSPNTSLNDADRLVSRHLATNLKLLPMDVKLCRLVSRPHRRKALDGM